VSACLAPHIQKGSFFRITLTAKGATHLVKIHQLPTWKKSASHLQNSACANARENNELKSAKLWGLERENGGLTSSTLLKK
jgi:hypothetical protein